MNRRLPRLLGLVTGVLVAFAPAASPAGPSDASLVASLSPGEHVFWRGLEGKGVHNFRLVLEAPAPRLRVLADTPNPFDLAKAWLIAPDGRTYRINTTEEALVNHPEPGTWRVQVETRSDTNYRLRAKLESRRDLAPPDPPKWLKPNLRSLPPFQFTFANPAPAVGVSASCQPDEAVEGGGRQCLRFSVGPENVGDGPFELYLAPLVDATVGEATVWQRLHHSTEEEPRLREAGTYEYHKTHGHYHYAGFASLELFEVVDERRGSLTPAGTGKKIGFCTVDMEISQFHRFAQDPRNSAESDCKATDGAWIGLSRGWTDIYDWMTSGNYVEFAGNGDGLYVVRSGFDVDDMVDETNERDNYAYALIEVTGSKVRLVERGYGRDPWDPRKEVVQPWWKA